MHESLSAVVTVLRERGPMMREDAAAASALAVDGAAS
jgi:hypothetical protein